MPMPVPSPALARIAAVVAVLAAPLPASAASTCSVKAAADAAVQRQITLIDAAKVNPSDFFDGANSCIATNLLQQFDLSNLIPDLSGFLTSAAQNLITQALNTAKQQVCSILNSQLQNVINQINSKLYAFRSTLSADLSKLLNGSTSTIMLPNVTGIGTYTFNASSSSLGSVLGVGSSSTTTTTTTDTSSGSSATSSGTTSNYSTIFNNN